MLSLQAQEHMMLLAATLASEAWHDATVTDGDRAALGAVELAALLGFKGQPPRGCT